MAQNPRARVTQVLVFGSIYQGAILVHVSEPQPDQENRGPWFVVLVFPNWKLRGLGPAPE